MCESVLQHFASYTAKPTTPASPSDAFKLPAPQPQGRESPPAATSFRDGQKIQPWTQSQVLTTFKAGSSSWSKHKEGAAGKKKKKPKLNSDLDLCAGESRWVLGRGAWLTCKPHSTSEW